MASLSDTPCSDRFFAGAAAEQSGWSILSQPFCADYLDADFLQNLPFDYRLALSLATSLFGTIPVTLRMVSTNRSLCPGLTFHLLLRGSPNTVTLPEMAPTSIARQKIS